MKRLPSLFAMILAASTFAVAGTYDVVSTTLNITSSTTPNSYYTQSTSTVDNYCAQISADMTRPIGPFESMSGVAYGSYDINYYTITIVVRYYADENEVVDTEALRQVFFYGRSQSKTTAYADVSGDYSYSWESEYATDTEAWGPNDYDEKGWLSSGTPIWHYDGPGLPYALFNLHSIGGGVYEGTAQATFGLPNSPAHKFVYEMLWTPFGLMESHTNQVTGLWRRQWRVVDVDGQGFSGY